ncbi:MAG: hypothetical protein FWC61_01565 [Proteobacteria bacterium]|nr:hypothetical protein [Pseudomonadota bacterium]
MKYIKFIFAILITILSCASARADISSAQYIHDMILAMKGVNVPIPPTVGTNNINANTLGYLMQQIDAANAQIGTFSNYAVTVTTLSDNVVSVQRVLNDIQDLIVYPTATVTVVSGNAFSFKISATGNFTIDWGDGTVPQDIVRTNTTATVYSHTYAAVGSYQIKITGRATGYNASTQIACVSFENETRKFNIGGSLGRVFPTLGTGPGLQPSFYFAFRMATGLTGGINPGLFDGIYGQPVDYMFADLFNGTNLTGTIPDGLFGGLSGAYAYGMFQSLFYNQSGLTGSIPPGMFGNLSGPAQPYIFANTFYGCTGLTGPIPAGLFGNPTGAPGMNMFIGTFYADAGLTGPIPPGLFGHLNGAPASKMFNNTFYQCKGLTGSVPAMLFGTLTGAPQASMFAGTFYQCSGLTGIADGIWDLTGMGTGATDATIFSTMFQGCTSIAGVASPTTAAGNGVKLWQHFSKITAAVTAFRNSTGLTDYASIPANWK